MTTATKDKAKAESNGAEAQVPRLPVASLKDAITELRRPFTPEAVKFKIQTNPKGDNGRAMIVTFIDARLVSERLNAVCPDLWATEFEAVSGGMLCKLTVDGQTRADAGHSENTGTDIGLKSLYSDAFKRAAVHFGVGASLYTLPRVYVAADRLKKVTRQDGKVLWFLPDATEQALRNGYATWLDEKGRRLFGEPLGHGDQEMAQGDHEVDPAPHPGDVPDTPPQPDKPTDKQLDFVQQLDFVASLAKKLGADSSDQDLLRAYANTFTRSEGTAAINALKGEVEGLDPADALVRFVSKAAAWSAKQSDLPVDTEGLELGEAA